MREASRRAKKPPIWLADCERKREGQSPAKSARSTKRREGQEAAHHEGERELVVVLEVNLVGRVAREVLLEEPGEELGLGVGVRVLDLDVDQVERGLGKELERVLGRGRVLERRLLLLVVGGLGGLGLGGLGRSLGLGGLSGGVLLGGNVGRDLGSERDAGEGLGDLGVVDNGLLEADDVGVLLLVLGAEELGEGVGEDAGDRDVGERDAVADEERVGREVLVERGEDGLDLLEAVLEDGLDEGDVVVEHAVQDRDALVDLFARSKERRERSQERGAKERRA